jgi:hypothetical protein
MACCRNPVEDADAWDAACCWAFRRTFRHKPAADELRDYQRALAERGAADARPIYARLRGEAGAAPAKAVRPKRRRKAPPESEPHRSDQDGQINTAPTAPEPEPPQPEPSKIYIPNIGMSLPAPTSSSGERDRRQRRRTSAAREGTSRALSARAARQRSTLLAGPSKPPPRSMFPNVA